ncbi:DUF1295 domain-containing protein [Nocardioides sp.]|uniref:DUF1295 domain-containing protein n=1 Tax=Nocardioides sp. TaxID=35761 RepID=UPI0035120E8D
MTKTGSLLRILGLYLLAVAVGAGWLLLGPDTAHVWLDTLVADLLATLVVFAGSRRWGNSSCSDAYWSVAPPLLLLAWWLEAPADADDGRIALVGLLVLAWAVRLTLNWARSFPGMHHEDWRYPILRERAGGRRAAEIGIDLAAIHVIPTLQVFLGLVPVYLLTRSDRPLGVLDVVALVIGVAAVTLETVADAQLRAFVADHRPGEVMDRGVWGWSRHPNYVGELGFWVALAVAGLAAEPSLWPGLLSLVGVVAMLAMFLGASIPMMEERSLARRPEYAAVIARVPRFLPRPPRRGAGDAGTGLA